jgi:large repetitive protein
VRSTIIAGGRRVVALLVVALLAAAVLVAVGPVSRASAASPASAPQNLAATPASAQATLTWTAPTDDGGAPVTGYRVEYRPMLGSSGWLTWPQDPATTTVTVTGLVNGEQYEIHVAALTSAGVGAFSSSVPVTPAGTDLTMAAGDQSPLAGAPRAIALAPDGGTAYIAGDDALRVVDTGTGATAVTVPVTEGQDVVVSPDGATVYVTSFAQADRDHVIVVDAASRTIVDTIPLGIAAYGSRLALSPDGGTLYVASQHDSYPDPDLTGTLSQIDTSTRTVTRAVTTASVPDAVIVSSDGATLFVAAQTAVDVVDAGTLTVARSISTFVGQRRSLAVSPDGTKLYVSTNANQIQVFDPSTGQASGQPLYGVGPGAIALSPTSSALIVAETSSSPIALVDTATTQRSVVQGPGHPWMDVAVSADGAHAYAVGGMGPAAKMFALTLRTAPSAPRDLSVIPDTDRATLQWSPPAAASAAPLTGYTVQYRRSWEMAWRTWPVAGLATEATITGLQTGETYGFRVMASNAVGSASTAEVRGVQIGSWTYIGALPLSSGPDRVVRAPVGDRAYTIGGGSNRVFAIDTAARAVIGSVDLPGPGQIAVSPDGAFLYVMGPYYMPIQVVDTTTMTISRTLPTGGRSFDGIAVSTDGTRLFLSEPSTGSLVSMNVVDGATSPTVVGGSLGSGPRRIAVRPDGSGVYMPVSGGVWDVDPDTGTSSFVAYPGGGVSFPALSPDGSRLYLADPIRSEVAVVDTATNTFGTAISSASPVSALAVSPDGIALYLLRGSEVEVIDLRTGTAFGMPMWAGGYGTDLVVTRDRRSLLVADPSNGMLNVLGPLDRPSAPRDFRANPGAGAVDLTWTMPAIDGGSMVSVKVEYRLVGDSDWIPAPGGALGRETVTGLDNGSAYEFRAVAENQSGRGPYAPSITATPFTTAGATTAPTTAPGDGQMTLTWAAPSDTGGSAITGYSVQYRVSGASSWQTRSTTGTATTTVVPGLVNGTEYEFAVAAVNEAGIGAYGDAATATPRTVPGAPTSVTAEPGDGRIAVTWAAPTVTGGASVTGYTLEYRESGGSWMPWATGIAGLDGTVTGLDNGRSYDVRVSAENAAGTGASAEVDAVVPRTVPNVPRGLAAMGGDGEVDLSWMVPDGDGGAAVSGYVVQYRMTSSMTWLDWPTTGTSTSTTITGLANGVAYQFQVAAENAAGRGTFTFPEIKRPEGAPNTPGDLVATAEDGQLALSWSEPGSGGSDITGYLVEYRVLPDGDWVTPAMETPQTFVTVPDLVNGTTYEVRVAARNALGTSAFSTPVSAMPWAVPGDPVPISALATRDGAEVTWTEPGDGGSPITGYSVRYRFDLGAGDWAYVDVDRSQLGTTLSGFDAGVRYEIEVAAVNAVGTGFYASAGSIVPYEVPGAPTAPSATRDDGRVEVTWSRPANWSLAGITHYEVAYHVRGDAVWGHMATDGLEQSLTIDNLTNGVEYEFVVTAHDDWGPGAATDPMLATPARASSIPTGFQVERADGAIDVRWGTPDDLGGTTLTGYVIEHREAEGGQWEQTTVDSSESFLSLPGLTNGVEYEVQIAAMTEVGLGTFTDPLRATPARVPGAPRDLQLTVGYESLDVAWLPPTDDGGDAVDHYRVEYRPAGDLDWSVSNEWVYGTTTTIFGLENGRDYDVQVSAVNAVGVGDPSDTARARPAGPPTEPTDVILDEGDRQVTVWWNEPGSDGGAPLMGYVVEHRVWGLDHWEDWIAVPGYSTSPTVVTGLTNGEVYEFRIAAINEWGSAEAYANDAVTPTGPPDAPDHLRAEEGDRRVDVSWDFPAFDGGSPVTGFSLRYRPVDEDDPQPWMDWAGDQPHTSVGDLTNGVLYEFEVAAVNARDTGDYSAPVTARPGTVPFAPDPPVLTAGGGQMLVTWTPPWDDGGSAVTGYVVEYSVAGAGDWREGPDPGVATSVTVMGLTDGTPYEFRVAAVNERGSGAFSPATTGTPQDVPGIPGDLVLTPGGGSITVSWTEPTSGGLPLDGYLVWHRPAGETAWTPGYSAGTATEWTISGLTNGRQYEVIVAALNELGEGEFTEIERATPLAVPGSPTGLVVAPAAGGVSASWTAPADTGGTPLTGYMVEYRAAGAPVWQVWPTTGLATGTTITGLPNGADYDVRVSARNAVGDGPTVGPERARPGQSPTGMMAPVVTAGNGQATVLWSAPSSDGGMPVTAYVLEYQPGLAPTSWLTWPTTGTDTTAVVTGLVNGQQYWFRVAAVNAVGRTYSPTQTATPVGPPGAPDVLWSSAGPGSVTVAWNPPPNTGGSPVTGYSLHYRAVGATSWETIVFTVQPAVVTGLTNGVTYQFEVAAINALGTGPYASAPDATPATSPDTPDAPTVTEGAAQLTVSWVAPADGGSPLTSYTLQHRRAGDAMWISTYLPATDTQRTLTGLIDGATYEFRVSAGNARATSPFSETASGMPRDVPGVPGSMSATRSSDGTIHLSWSAPDAHGAAVTAYTVEYRRNGAPSWTVWPTGDTTTHTVVSGLTYGEPYEFRVRATNALGDGSFTEAVPRTPYASPGVPTAPTAVAGDGRVDLAWVAPASDGGSPITGYVVRYRSSFLLPWSDWPTDGTGTTTTVTGLVNGTSYTFEITAETAYGTSSAATVTAQPATVPEAPTDLSLIRRDRAVTLSWTAPANGGSFLTGYTIRYRIVGSGTWDETTATVGTVLTTVSGLVNGEDYEFQVAAKNTMGTGAYTSPATMTPGTAPGAPAQLSAVAGDGTVSLTWAPPAVDGGIAVHAYVLEYLPSSDTTWRTWPTTGIETSAEVTGLTNGTWYMFRLAAVNEVGQGLALTTIARPVALPGIPSGVTATPGDGRLAVAWTAPADGGSALTGYAVEYQTVGASSWMTWPTAGTGTTTTITGLANGTPYAVRVSARNAVGGGEPSEVASGIPVTVPGTPGGMLVRVADAAVELSWTAPANGGSALTGYVVEYRAEGAPSWTTWPTTGTGTAVTVTGLVNGTDYEFRVAAVTAVGQGAYAVSAPVTPVTVPAAPGGLALTVADARVDLAWSPPATDGGSPVTGYAVEYRVAGVGSWTGWPTTGTATTASITGLVNGTTYEFRVAAANAVGTGAFVLSPNAIPVTLPGVPGDVTVTVRDGAIGLAWTAPADGGSPILRYAVEYRPAGDPAWSSWPTDGTATATVVEGLANGGSYGFRVAAVTAVGTGAPSDPVAGIPAAVPDEPRDLQVQIGDGSVALSWTTPAHDGGDAVTAYAVATRPAGTGAWDVRTIGGTATTTTVTGLTNGAPYEFRIAAVNGRGTGPYGETVTATPATVPDAPLGLEAVSADGRVVLAWTAPDDGGSPVTGYGIRYRAEGDADWSAGPSAITEPSATVDGLVNGTPYEFEVTATNARGTGAAAAATATPAAVPDAPRAPEAIAEDAAIRLTWQTPADDHGSPVTGYLVQFRASDATSWTLWPTDGAATSARITGLVNGTPYVVRIAAVSVIGTGPFTEPVEATPVTVPGAPTAFAAVAGDGRVALSWAAPAADGGSPVTGYALEFRADGASDWTPWPADGTTATVTGLANGTAHAFRVAAVTGIGTGAFASASAVPVGVPGTPSLLAAEPWDREVRLSWSAPVADGGSPVTGYALEYRAAGGDWVVWPVEGPATTAVVTGLQNGAAYEVRLAAVNAVGAGAFGAPAGVAPRAPTIEAPGSAARGGTVEVSGSGLNASSAYVLVLHSDPVELGPIAVAPDGTFRTSVQIPDGVPEGDHVLAVHADAASGERLADVPFAVHAAVGAGGGPSAPGGGALPITGAEAVAMSAPVVAGLLAVMAGAILLIVRRRRTERR